MSNFMDRLKGKKSSAAQSAKERLKLVLVTDRSSLSPEDLRNMQREILAVIRKYCRVEDDDVDMKLEQRDRENYLVADIPLIRKEDNENIGSVHMETALHSGDIEDDESTLPMMLLDLSGDTNTPADPPAKPAAPPDTAPPDSDPPTPPQEQPL